MNKECIVDAIIDFFIKEIFCYIDNSKIKKFFTFIYSKCHQWKIM